jgi:adenosylmethionine-8-amino-7-oxononanoate aminotransferase
MSESGKLSHLFTLDPTRAYPTLVRGEGVYVYDDQGRQYLDAAAGIGVVAIGYGRRRVVQAMADQALKLPYVAPNLFGNEPAARLAGQMARLTPGDCTSIQFTSGGSEAVEVALKICRQVNVERGQASKHLVVARWTSYHGATLGALSATGHAGRRKKFAPLLLDWPHIPPVYCYRCPYRLTHPGCGLPCARALEETIQRVGPENVMAFIAEPVVGAAGGAIVPPPEYWPLVRDICTRHDVLLIADEVLTGFGRTGRRFAVDHWNVAPDLITMAKGISGGYAPLGAVAVSQRIRAVFEEQRVPFDHVFTYSADPIAAAAASEVLAIWEEEGLTEQAARVGEVLIRRLAALKEHPIVGDVRGLGLMVALEFVRDRATREPFPAEAQVAKLVGKLALEHGLITYPGTGMVDGVRGDVISLFPSLTFTLQHVDELMSRLDATLTRVEAIL